ncbi:MAG TPA: DinB family protein [Thermomicrobiales bacterium]|nr:DinB family protein [Thermomicrobiales bacterium]
MATVSGLIADVVAARERVTAAVEGMTPAQAAFRPGPGEWSATEVIEHLVLAEQSGINRIWQAAEGQRLGRPVWSGEPVHRGLPIEEIIAKTWRDKEQAPTNATPQAGGPLAYWVACLRACQPVLETLGAALAGLDLSEVIFPHFLSGPLDAYQRLEFLRWHLDHHRRQLDDLTAAPGYPR